MACSKEKQTLLTFCFNVFVKEKDESKRIVVNKINSCDSEDIWNDVLTDLLDAVDEPMHKTDVVTVSVAKNTTSTEKFHPDGRESIRVVYDFDQTLKYVTFVIERESTGVLSNENASNAFTTLMDSQVGTKPPKEKSDGARFTAKDRLYNEICAHMTSSDTLFPCSMLDDTVRKHVEVITNTMWYLDGNKDKLRERAQHAENVKPLPDRFSENFNNFNDWKKKKQKAPKLQATDLKKHSGSIFRLVSMAFTHRWGSFRSDLEQLALALDTYAEYLEDSNEQQVKRQKLDQPTRKVGEHSEMQHRQETDAVSQRYTNLDNVLCGKGCYEYVVFNEESHCLNGVFKNFNERHFFLHKLQLSVPVDMLTYSPGGQHHNLVLLWRTQEGRSDAELMNESMKMFEKVRPLLPEFHTRQMKSEFRQKYAHLAVKVPPAVLRNIYADLTLDASADQNPALDERIRQAILSEDCDLVTDMRHLNKGRPNDTYKVFFEKFEEKIEQQIAADERRHNVEHLSQFISVKDLISQVCDDLEEGTPIPSESTVLFSFVPKNAHKKSAKLYKAKVPLQFKVQTRQLRSSHMDDHYCAAVFKYMRQYAIKYREECSFLCVDDKAKVDIGEPGSAVSTGVRGKKSIVPTTSFLSALDHDLQSKGSLTPSVALMVDVPEKIEESFYRGTVTVKYKDAVFQPSTPFRHAVEMKQILTNGEANEEVPPILMIFSDGGPDHRITYHSVKIALIVLFKMLNLDMLIAGRTAPGHSWLNPAERIMSVLNLALQNVALMREECRPGEIETTLKGANSMADIRKKAERVNGLKDSWLQSMGPIIELLDERTRRLSLKNKQFQCQTASTDDEVKQFEEQVLALDNSIVLGQYQEKHLKAKADYQLFLTNHCRQRQYLFQVKKCDDQNCCQQRRSTKDLPFVPDPLLKPDDNQHFQSFENLLGKPTTEIDRPSAQNVRPNVVAEALQGARIWLADPDLIWRGAELLDDYKGAPCSLKAHFEDADETVVKIKDKTQLPHLRNPEILIGENDLTSLSYLNEPEVLYNLKVRFEERNIIYTYCGIVLVAINPYEQLDIYNNDIIQAYSGQDMGAMDPHVYAVAEEAFKRMSRFEQNQSIIVSGESGAGKTVSAKYAMRFFAMVGGSQDTETQIEKRVLASNPIMEAIGNAKTTRNDNSSRFGKYIEISFDRANHIVGANMRTYLLEKSRVVFQAKDERNYHIFYQLCASRDRPELKKFGLLAPEKFYYTSQGKNALIDDVDDAKDLQGTKDAMKMLGFAERDIMVIFQILAGVLHFGNVKINEKDGESSEMEPKDPSIGLACKLLGIDEQQMRTWICNKKITTVGETLTKPLTQAQASFAQDALSKCIYSKLFDWIVHQINKSLKSTSKVLRFIGVLDIYGFETFQVNSFEQFCINYANEKLQQIFNMHVFKLEQEEYVKEEIEWSFIDYYDNQPCIDLIEAKLGILDLLDEECKVPNGSDLNWCQKLYGKHTKHSHFQKPRMGNDGFIIAHFADKVTYTARGFLDKNRDAVSEEHVNIMKASEYELVAELFSDVGEAAAAEKGGRVQALKSGPKGGSKQMKRTVGSQFRDSLFLLMDTLNSTSPHYIRCIKPNDLKAAFEFDPKRAVEQLRACGVLETIRISAAGFPSRWTYPEFFQRYRVLALSKDINRKDYKKSCRNVLPKLIQDEDKYRFGKTKIFFRAGQVAYLEKLRADKLRACGIMIQKHVRGWLMKNKYTKLRRSAMLVQRYGRGLLARKYCQYLRETKAATRIQKTWRGFRCRRDFHRVQYAVIRLQSAIRGFFGRRRYLQMLYEHQTTVIQAKVRGFLIRKQFKRVMYGIVKIQSHFRRRKAKAEFKKLKIEARSVDSLKNVNKGLENKIIQLQQQVDANKKVSSEVTHKQEAQIKSMETELEKLRGLSAAGQQASNRVTTLEEEIRRLQKELEQERGEKQDLLSEKEQLKQKTEKEISDLQSENIKVKAELENANRKLKEQVKTAGVQAGVADAGWEDQRKQMLAEMESERQHHQRLVKEHNRLLQRFENMQGEMQLLTSPTGHKRTPSDISMISLESVTSSVSPDDKKDEEGEGEKEDQGYGTEKKKRQAPAPPSALAIEKTMKEAATEKADQEKEKQLPVVQENIDVGLMLKLQNKVKSLEKEREQLLAKLETLEEEAPKKGRGGLDDSAFNALKDLQERLVNADDVALVIKLQKRVKDLEAVKHKLSDELDEREEQDERIEERRYAGLLHQSTAYDSLKMQELENENDKLKREVAKLMESIAKSGNLDKGRKMSPAGKEFMDQFGAMADELERRREECLQLRALLAEKSISTHTIAKQSYGGQDNIVNEDNELTMAYKSQRDIIRLLEDQLQKAEKDLKKKSSDYENELKDLKRENDKQQKMIQQSLSLGPDAKIEATMQHEITRLTGENLDLREVIDKQADQIRKLKKMLKVYAKRMKEGDAAEIQAELEQEETKSVENVAQIKHRARNYMGMLEYKKEEENTLIKLLVLDLKPRVASGLLPGLPAYLLFMCVRHTDYINDDEKVRTFLTNTINGIKKVVKKHHDDIDRVVLWLGNTCRFLHNLKQYSGEKTFQQENTSRQNEHCLRNFDLSEYRQVFSDLAVWIYQTLIKLMEATIQPSIVPAVLEHEAIAGLTGSKPSGLRGRSSSRAEDTPEHSLDSLMKALNHFVRVMTQHAIDPELVKQIYRQLYYFIGASALNNLLLRKEMCNWSKGMQIRYNLSHLEQWLRDSKLQESGAGSTLEAIIQASQLLQARKTDADVDSVCEMCSKLSVAQIVKILNLYTPVDEFEERVPISFIRKIQVLLKKRDNLEINNSLLMDLKYSFSVTFPFNPSKIALETIDMPEQLHLGNVVTRV